MYIYFVEKGNHSYFLKMGSIVNCDNLKYKETNVKNLENGYYEIFNAKVSKS